MPHEMMNVQQAARYLRLSAQEVLKLASRGHLPARKVGGQFRFIKSEIDHYVETCMPDLSHDRMTQIEQGVSDHHGLDVTQAVLLPLIPSSAVLVPLNARTRDSAIRTMVQAAEAVGLVYDPNDLVDKILQREDLLPTTMAPEIALPHPRHPLPYDIARSFVVIGRADSGIAFGAPDGSLTRLFFLICCKDDRTHLHVLARISRILEPATIQALLDAPDAAGLRSILERREQEVMGQS